MRPPGLSTSLNAMTSTTAPISLRPRREAEVLLHCVSKWPYVRVDVQGDDAGINSGIPRTCVARLRVDTGALTVFVSAEEVTTLLATEPLIRRSSEGVYLGVHDTDSRTAGERLLRWRLDLERFAPQLRAASP
jgi:hypothetical protein